MTGSLASVQRLRRVAAALAAGDPDQVWLGARLQSWLEQGPDGATLEEELGLARGWRQAQRLVERNALLRELAGLLEGSPTARAHELALTMRRYAGTGWSLDRRRGVPTMPGRRRALLFAIFTTDPTPPLGFRQLFEIIAP